MNDDALLRNTTIGGKTEGLQVLLKVDPENYIDFLSETTGYEVSVFDPVEPPDFDSNFIVERTKTVDLAMKRREVNLLEPEKGGNCLKGDAWEHLFPEHGFRCEYQNEICTELEQILRIREGCNCTKVNDILGTIVIEKDETLLDSVGETVHDTAGDTIADSLLGTVTGTLTGLQTGVCTEEHLQCITDLMERIASEIHEKCG
ncbi:unnamed protein product, partial [Cyprideis torosa]